RNEVSSTVSFLHDSVLLPPPGGASRRRQSAPRCRPPLCKGNTRDVRRRFWLFFRHFALRRPPRRPAGVSHEPAAGDAPNRSRRPRTQTAPPARSRRGGHLKLRNRE